MPSINQAYFTTAGGGNPFSICDAPPGIVGLNRMCLRTGASRYGKGVFCMQSSDYDALVSAAGKTAQATLTLTGVPGPGVSLTVIIAGAEPLVQNVTSDDSTDMMKVTVYDVRCRNFSPIKKFYNVMQQDFPQDGSGKPQCYASTFDESGNSFEWESDEGSLSTGLIVDATLFLAAQLPDDLPGWTPYNLIWDNVPAARACDDVAARLFYVVGFDHQNCTAGNNYGLSLFAPGDGFEENGQVLQQAAQYQTDGSDAERNQSRLPGAITVCFQAYNADDPSTDPFAQRSYEKVVNVDGGSSDIRVPLHVAENIAIWKGGAYANQSDLDEIANDLAPRAAAFIGQSFLQYRFPGIWPFKPDGNYRQVEWINDASGAFTLLRSDNARDWLPTDALSDPINLVSNQEVVGIGTSNFTIGPGGTKVGWAAGNNGVKVKVGTNIAAGKYNATIYSGTATDAGTGNLTLPDGLTAGQSALLLVSEEDSAVVDGFTNVPAAKQRLMQNSYALGQYIGNSTEGTPRPIILVRGGVGSMSGATTIDPSPTQTTADSTTWTRALTGTPVNIYLQTRTAYDSTANQLVFFQRQVSYDARGLCYRVGPEEKITVMGGCS